MQLTKPIVQEICVFILSFGGPWIYLLLCYISNSLVKFSKYISKRLGKNEMAATNRSLAILANFWSKLTEFYHGHTVVGLENIPSNSGAILGKSLLTNQDSHDKILCSLVSWTHPC